MNPLAGHRVLDLTRLLPGAVTSLLLAELGAEVVKVEPPDGDYARRWPPGPAAGAAFRTLARGKEIVPLNLKAEGDRRAFLERVREADVLLEGFRPGVMERLGVGWERLREVNPRLIYCSLSGFGRGGPRAREAGHDLTYLARAAALGSPPRMPPVTVADLSGAYLAALAVVAALYERSRTGRGRFLEVALYDGALWSALPFLAEGIAGGDGRWLTGGWACYNLYRTADGGWMALAALEPSFFRAFLEAVERPDLLPLQYDPEAQDRLQAELAALFAARTRAEWEAFLARHEGADLCLSPVLSPWEVLSDPQALARGLRREGSVLRLPFPARTEEA